VLTGLATGGMLIALLPSPAIAQAKDLVIIGKDHWLFPAWESLIDANLGGVVEALALIREAERSLGERNIHLLIVVAPLKARLYRPQLPDGTVFGRRLLDRYDWMLERFKAEGIAAIDVQSIAESMIRSGTPAFFRTDYHWTAALAEAAATAAAADIAARWPLPREPVSAARLGPWIENRNEGDLARLLPAEQRKSIPPEVMLVRGQPDGGALLSEERSPVHVVGNSFVQPYLGFAQILSHRLQAAVSLTWNYGNIGPWMTMLNYVESDEFRTRPPQVVVWQFNEAQLATLPDAAGMWDPTALISRADWLARIEAAVRR
jgi:alginate O-acetyltransferase complex protein AlgJ